MRTESDWREVITSYTVPSSPVQSPGSSGHDKSVMVPVMRLNLDVETHAQNRSRRSSCSHVAYLGRSTIDHPCRGGRSIVPQGPCFFDANWLRSSTPDAEERVFAPGNRITLHRHAKYPLRLQSKPWVRSTPPRYGLELWLQRRQRGVDIATSKTEPASMCMHVCVAQTDRQNACPCILGRSAIGYIQRPDGRFGEGALDREQFLNHNRHLLEMVSHRECAPLLVLPKVLWPKQSKTGTLRPATYIRRRSIVG